MSRIVPNEGETLDEARKRLKKEAKAREYQKNKEKRREYKRKYRENGVSNTDTDWYMRNRYGISLDDYNRMFADQGGVCAVCSSPPGGTNGQRRFHIDHDHATGKVRGLLCHRCNLALGCVDDDVDRLMGLVAYMLEHQSVLTVTNTIEQGVTP